MITEIIKHIFSFAKTYKLTAALVLLALISISWFFATQDKSSDGASYEVEKVERGNIESIVSSSGQVGDISQISVVSEVSGDTEFLVKEGQEVKKGDIIAKIDSSGLETDIYQAQLSVNSAQLNLDKLRESTSDTDIIEAENSLTVAKNNLKELKLTQKHELEAARDERDDAMTDFARDAANRKIKECNQNHPFQIEEAENAIKKAEAVLSELRAGTDPIDIELQEVAVARAQSELYELVQGRPSYSILAPESGLIAELNTGGSGEDGIATIISKEKEAEIIVNQVDIHQIKKGQKAILTLDAIESLEIEGSVKDIDLVGSTESGVVSYNVTLSFDSQDSRIMSSMTVNADIITESKKDILVVPSAVIQAEGENEFIEVAIGDIDVRSGVVLGIETRMVKIKTGLTDGIFTEIKNGLEEGDVIILRTITSSETSEEESEKLKDKESDDKRGSGGIIPIKGVR